MNTCCFFMEFLFPYTYIYIFTLLSTLKQNITLSTACVFSPFASCCKHARLNLIAVRKLLSCALSLYRLNTT
ncbi:unnamed protein product [Phytomonas sp. EM1]|nr:unnamed protein product [Phytomonas sp. EM1]|eukprot:CCW61868.1 unnamed protein product [Phytomonas sp. isolate EM1]